MYNTPRTTMVVKSGLTGNKGYEVLSSVKGQMSDGKWENYSPYEKFWKNCDIRQSDNAIIVSKDYNSGFRDMTASQVREFFCRRIEAVLKDFIHYMRTDAQFRSYSSMDNCDFLSYKERISVNEIKLMVAKMRALNKTGGSAHPFGL